MEKRDGNAEMENGAKTVHSTQYCYDLIALQESILDKEANVMDQVLAGTIAAHLEDDCRAGKV